MHTLAGKIGLAVGAYWQARQAIRRQYHADAIRETRNAKLQKLVRHSFDNVKYYRELFHRAGLTPEEIRTTEDLQRLPILTKAELRGRFWEFLPARVPPARATRTSGSTGVPVCIFSDASSRKHNSAAVIRFRRAVGIPLIGRPILSPLKTEDDPPKAPHWTFVQGIHKTYYVNPYDPSPTNFEHAGALLEHLKQPALIGITPAVRRLAERVSDDAWPNCRPSAIITIGETLSPSARNLIESAFGTRITDLYACAEAGDVAWECPLHHGYHINADNCIVEIVKDDEPVCEGQVGEVVITNLNRYVMPLLRYKNGDLARLGPERCPCGRQLPMLAEIIGRSGEDMVLPDGKKVPWNQLKSLMTHQQIRQFQLIQQADGSLAVQYVPERQADTKQIEDLLGYRYRNLLGPSVPIRIEATSSIPPAPTGKSKLVVSHYDPDRSLSAHA